MMGIELTWQLVKPYSLTLFVLTTGWAAFNRYLWKQWPVSIFCGVPNLNGTWRVELQSSYRDPISGAPAGVTYGYAAIRQNFSALSIRLMTAQAESFLVTYSFTRHNDGCFRLYGVYQSDPEILQRGAASQIHYGSFQYKILKDSRQMSGYYWTDRNTNGSITLHNKVGAYFDSYTLAAADIGKTS
ncbi:hypothetical protein [Rhizobium sp. L51/94]|nr:hypothetical protein J5274_22370 [Rhizobium sp. L51/94]